MEIESITIVTAQGVKQYHIGMPVGHQMKILSRIEKGSLFFTGDPYDHYIGYDANREMLFSINCLVPCEVVYKPTP